VVLGYDQNVPKDSIFLQLQHELLYKCQQFYCPISAEYLELNCKTEYTYAMEGIMPEFHHISVEYTENDLDYTFHDPVHSFPALYLSWTPPTEIPRLKEYLNVKTMLSIFLSDAS
jgi:hypothetical protein